MTEHKWTPYLGQCYEAMQKWSGLKVGDKVRVTRAADQFEMGWKNGWVHTMDDSIGKTYTVYQLNGSLGIRLAEFPNSVDFPFFVLEKINDDEDSNV